MNADKLDFEYILKTYDKKDTSPADKLFNVNRIFLKCFTKVR